MSNVKCFYYVFFFNPLKYTQQFTIDLQTWMDEMGCVAYKLQMMYLFFTTTQYLYELFK